VFLALDGDESGAGGVAHLTEIATEIAQVKKSPWRI
jgi:hypothetical protein